MKMLIQFGDTTLMKSEFIIIIIIIIFLLLLFVDDVVVGVGIYTYADSNEEVRAKIQQVTGPHEDLTIVKRRKLQRCGHVSRSSGLAKTILQGTVIGGRRQGRQRKTWEDNIREWTGRGFGKSQRVVENWEKWRKLVAKSSVVPQRPSRLRDR